MQRWKRVYDLIEKCDCTLGYQRSEAEIESEDGQFSQRCHFLITHDSIRVRQDAQFDKSANIIFFAAIITDYNGRIFISMVMVKQ